MIRLKRLYANDFKQLREIELYFPDAGRILVQGNNEAGKSTLFEAVFFALFGQALATESVGRPNLDDLIGYEKNKARVELDIAARDQFIRITRTLNRGKANVWELEIAQGDQIETIKGNRPVNDRLVLELGFDAEALLNTCFVEQKKLEKLEGLTKAKREESLSKLLNLERLLEIEEKLRLRNEDEMLLARLSKRVQLAEAQGRLPPAEAELTKIESQLKLIELGQEVERALEERQAASELRRQLEVLHSRREELQAAVATVDSLDRGRRVMATAIDRFDLLSQQTSSLEAMRRERDETEQAARDNLPALEHRSAALRRLAHGFERLRTIQEARDSAASDVARMKAVKQEIDAGQERSGEMSAQIVGLEARVLELDAHLRDYEIGEALGAWALLADEESARAGVGKEMLEKKHRRDSSFGRFRSTSIVSALVLTALAAGTLLLPFAVSLWSGGALPAIGFGVALVLVDMFVGYLLTRRCISVWRAYETAATDLAKYEGETSTRLELAAGSTERMDDAISRLRGLGVAIPSSVQAARARRVETAASLEGRTFDELNSERVSIREKLNYVRAQRDEVLRHCTELKAAADEGDFNGRERRVERAEKTLNRWLPRLSIRAAELQTLPDFQAIRDSRQEAESQRKSWQMRIQQAEKLGARIKEGESRVAKITGDLKAAYELARGLLEGVPPTWSAKLGRSDYVVVEADLAKAFQAHGGDQVRAQLSSVEKEIGASEKEATIRDKVGHDASMKALAIIDELNVDESLSAEPSIQELQRVAGRLKGVKLEEKQKLAELARSVQLQVGALRNTRDLLERELGLIGQTIDARSAGEELDELAREQTERKHGAEIVMRARKRIVQKVLPVTMDYMRRILPQLTRDRYHDAELDPETYKIRVWDERAGQSGAWKEKNIFSGGTKDQFSLALRLAFALATLPQERGATPGFIFLDEPLGSFDDERAAALLYLLTEGEIARAFDQILLISHVRVREDLFTHQIRLENGTLVENNLTKSG